MKINTVQTQKFRSAIQRYIAERTQFISLGLGEPEIETPFEIKEAAFMALKEGYTRYSSSFGLDELREKLSHKFNVENNIDSNKNNILVTPGGKNALFIACLGLVEEGDEIINFSPCYVSNIPILQLSSRNIVIKNVQLSFPDFKIDRKKIEEKLSEKTKILLMNFPNNPTGALLNKNDADYLAELVKEKKLLVISDEVYSNYIFSSENVSLGSYSEIKDQVVTINSFSKSHFMTGWRIGYLNANEDLIKELANVNLHINTNTAAFIQKAAIAALDMGEDHLKEYLPKIKERREIFQKIINEVYPDFKLMGGGLFAFLNISNTNLKSDEFAANLLEKEKVAVVPGINFGNNFDDYCRISFACKEDEFEDGINRIKRFIENI